MCDILIADSDSTMRRFESSRPSQPVRRVEKMSLSLGERPANGGLLRITHESLGSDFGHSRSEIADSLRQTFEKLPFLGDCGWRPGPICTAWPSLQYNSPNSPPIAAGKLGMPSPHCRAELAVECCQIPRLGRPTDRECEDMSCLLSSFGTSNLASLANCRRRLLDPTLTRTPMDDNKRRELDTARRRKVLGFVGGPDRASGERHHVSRYRSRHVSGQNHSR
jgi:hypothetical protein